MTDMTMTPEQALETIQRFLTSRDISAFDQELDVIRTALSRPVVPEGWKLVPVEPTQEMLNATSWPGCAKTDYKHMLAAAPEPAEQHPDDAAVDQFAQVMKAKLAKARAKGRSGWDDPAQCSPEYLADLLAGHVRKGNDGNFVDVANFAMMLHQRDAAPSVMPDAIRRSTAEESSEAGCYDCGLRYGGPSWIEAVIPDKAWNLIRPEGAAEGCGILCISCIAKRLREHGIEHCPVWLCGTEPLRPFGQKDPSDNMPVLRLWEPGDSAEGDSE